MKLQYSDSPRMGDPDRPYRPERFYPLCGSVLCESRRISYSKAREIIEREHGDSPFIDLMCDSAFKIVFGNEDNADLLRDWLNSMLPAGHRIKTLSYDNTEIAPKGSDGRIARIDLHCRNEKDEHFVVEVQKYPQTDYYKRAVYYGSLVYSLTAGKGKRGYKKLKPTFVIALMDTPLPFDRSDERWQGRYVSEYVFMEKNLHAEDLKDTISIMFGLAATYTWAPRQLQTSLHCTRLLRIFVEAYRFHKKPEECKSLSEMWLWYFCNMKDISEIPKALNIGPFRKLCEVSRLTALTKEQTIQYAKTLMNEWDYEDALETVARQSREQGREQGAADRSVEIAQNLKVMGMSDADISKATGLPAEKLAAL